MTRNMSEEFSNDTPKKGRPTVSSTWVELAPAVQDQHCKCEVHVSVSCTLVQYCCRQHSDTMLRGVRPRFPHSLTECRFENSVHEMDGAGFQIHAKHRDLVIERRG